MVISHFTLQASLKAARRKPYGKNGLAWLGWARLASQAGQPLGFLFPVPDPNRSGWNFLVLLLAS